MVDIAEYPEKELATLKTDAQLELAEALSPVPYVIQVANAPGKKANINFIGIESHES